MDAELSDIYSSKISRSLEVCRMSPAQRRPDRRASLGRSQQDALALGACGRAQRTMGGEQGAAPPAPGFRTLGRTHPAFVSPAGRACRRRAATPSVSAGLRRAGGREVAGRKRRAAGRSPGRRESRRPLCSGRPASRDKDGGLLSANRLAGWDSRLCSPEGTRWSPNSAYPGPDQITPHCPS